MTRRFLLYMGGQAVSNLGDHISELALGLIVIQLTGSAFLLGALNAVSQLPNLGLTLIAGTVADRADRRRLMIAMDGSRALLIALVPTLALLGRLEVWHLFVVGFLMSTLDTFFDVSAVAMLPELARKDRIGAANGYLYTMQASTGIVGPALAGAVIATVGTFESMYFDGASYIVSVGSLVVIGFGARIGRGALDAGRATAGFWHDLVAGLRYTVAQPVLRSIGGMMFIVNVASSAAFGVLLYHANVVIGLSPAVIGVTFSAGTVGFLLGSLVASRLGARYGRARIAMLGNVIGAMGHVAFAFSREPVLLAVGGALKGVNGPLVNVNTFTIRHESVPPHLLGRVFAVARFLAWSGNPLGALAGGFAAERIGTPPVFAAAAALTLAGAAFGWFGGLRRA